MDVSSLVGPSQQANVQAQKSTQPAKEKVEDRTAKSQQESAPAPRADFLSGQNLDIKA